MRMSRPRDDRASNSAADRERPDGRRDVARRIGERGHCAASLLGRAAASWPSTSSRGPSAMILPASMTISRSTDRQHVVAMGRHDQRLVGRQRGLQMVDEIELGLGVHRAGRLVEEQQLRRADQRARQHQQRALPARQRAIRARRPAGRTRRHRATGRCRRPSAPRRRSIAASSACAAPSIRLSRTVPREQLGVLADEAEAVAHLVRVILAAVEAVDRHRRRRSAHRGRTAAGRASTCPTRRGR